LLGIGLTWACVFILYYGLTHATLDGRAFIFPVFQPGHLLILLSAPMAQSAFYILARKTSWLLNIYLATAVLCCVIGWLHLTNDDGFRGYRFTYRHQGDLLCLQGCDDTWIFSSLILVQGCISMLWDVWRGAMRLFFVTVLLWLLLTSYATLMSM
jgi:hypothetical protein